MTPKLSIIVPVYNAERYIKRCMDSLYAQTLIDYEVILVDDGSTDSSLQICRNYARKDPRVKVIAKANGGAGSARNAGIEVANGEYIAFPDVDDWFEASMYEDLYRVASAGDYDVIFSGVNYYKQTKSGMEYFRTENINAYSYTTREDCRRHIMDFFPTTTIFDVPWNKLYRRRVIVDNDIRFADLRRCQDAMFNVDFFNSVDRVCSVEKAYYNYMLNTASDVQRKFPKSYIDICVAYYTHLIDVLKSWGVYSDKVRKHYDSSFVISIFATVCMYDNPRWQLNRNARKLYVTEILKRSEIRSFLQDADVRSDVTDKYEMLLKADHTAIMRYKVKEDLKDKLRSIKILTYPYRLLRRIK